MGAKPPKYSYFVAIILGLLILYFSTTGPFSFTLNLSLLFLLGGGLLGFLWQAISWRWGFWIAGPIIVLLSLSVLFSGQLDVFITKDLPPLLLGITAACVGSFVSSWYKTKKK